MNRTVIKAHELSIGYPKSDNRSKRTKLYDGLSFELRAGELTCLLGANGAGKSTLLRTLSALQKPLSGTITLYGKDLTLYTDNELSTLLGLVLTDKTSVGGLTVRELVSLGRYPYTGFFGKLSPNDHRIVEQAMQDVSILHKADAYTAQLSDGERQKAIIAKALAQECPIILLDEPTAFLDVASRIEIMSLLHHLANTLNKTILLSTHDIELALLLADRLWLLSSNKGLVCGATEDVVLSDALINFFDNDNILFDKHTGSFLPRQLATKYAYIETTAELSHWVTNLLVRNGYKLTTDTSTNSLSLVVTSPNTIHATKDGKSASFSSFEQLVDWIKS